MRNPESLKVFQAADAFAVAVYEWSASLPSEEKYGLTSQIRRAPVSIISNLAEGCSRESAADFRRFVEISLGSAMEVRCQLSLASRVHRLEEVRRGVERYHLGGSSIVDEANRLVQMLINFLKGLRQEA